MLKKNKISVALATYNGAKYIEAQLNSFINQVLQPDEVVISDDMSEDNTVELIESFSKIAPFEVILLKNKKNLGYSQNFNNALIHTTGDIVFLSDQDDVWFPNKISYMIEVINNKPNFMIYINDAELTDAKLKSSGLTKYDQIKSARMSDLEFVMGCCCAIKRQLLDCFLPIPTCIKGHDNWLVEIADGLGQKLIVPKTLQFYRRHGSNESISVVNRLQKVNAWSKNYYYFKRIFRKDSIEIMSAKILQLECFLNGLLVNRNIPDFWNEEFLVFIGNRKNFLFLAKSRYELRKLKIHQRIFKAIKLFISGYEKDKRLGSFIRDIIG